MKAFLKQYQQSPRKVRLIADMVRGKQVARALTELDFIPHRASLAVKKLISSALANARNNDGNDGTNLIVKEIRVDDGKIMYRGRPRSRGRSSIIRKRTSHIHVTLGEKELVESVVETSDSVTRAKKTKTVKNT